MPAVAPSTPAGPAPSGPPTVALLTKPSPCCLSAHLPRRAAPRLERSPAKGLEPRHAPARQTPTSSSAALTTHVGLGQHASRNERSGCLEAPRQGIGTVRQPRWRRSFRRCAVLPTNGGQPPREPLGRPAPAFHRRPSASLGTVRAIALTAKAAPTITMAKRSRNQRHRSMAVSLPGPQTPPTTAPRGSLPASATATLTASCRFSSTPSTNVPHPQ